MCDQSCGKVIICWSLTFKYSDMLDWFISCSGTFGVTEKTSFTVLRWWVLNRTLFFFFIFTGAEVFVSFSNSYIDDSLWGLFKVTTSVTRNVRSFPLKHIRKSQ